MGLLDNALLSGQSSEWLSILFIAFVKSCAILAAAAFVDLFLRPASAKSRHIVWCATLASVLVLPLLPRAFQPVQLPVLPAGLVSNETTARQTTQDAAEELTTATPISSGPVYRSEQDNRSSPSLFDEQRLTWQSIILFVWLTGALLVLGRYLVGFLAMRRLIHHSSELTDRSWSALSLELSQQLRLRHRVSLLRSSENVMPMACGGLTAVVLLPNDVDRWSADRRLVVLLHELIHIKRRDLLIQAFAQIACAIYWFNPLAWWAVQRLRTEQEWACDEHVVAMGIARPDYAAHLLAIARKFHTDRLSALSTTAIARPSRLQGRLCAILKSDRHFRSGRIVAVSVVVMGAVFISTAVTQLVTAQRETPTEVLSITNGVIQVEQDENDFSEQTPFVTDKPGVTLREVDSEFHQTQTPTPTPTPVAKFSDQSTDSPTVQFTASHQTAGIQTADQVFNSFSEEERSRLLSNGIGTAYINEMADAGYGQLTVDKLIQLFNNSVRADYIAGLRSVGYDHVSVRDLLSLKTNGVTPGVIKSYQAVSHAGIEAKKYVALLSNDVTPLYWRSLADSGYDTLSANKAIELRLAGVTSDFIREARSRGYVNLSANELIELKRSEKY